MNSMHELLKEAETTWREEVKRDFPLRSDTPVVKRAPSSGRDWEFSTDLKSIYAALAHNDALRKKFETIVAKYWSGSPEILARDTLHYLLFHELYHPVEAPFSVSGPDNDNKRIHQAIRKGIIKAEPELSPLEQVVKVHACENAVKDFILDNRFALDNKENGYVQEDVIPVWDLLELHDEAQKMNFYTITRFLYGILYGPESVHAFFEEKTGKKGVDIAEQALTALIGRETVLPRQKSTSFISKAKKLIFGETTITPEQLQTYVQDIRTVFSGKDRYQGIERLMSVLGPYVEKDMPHSRPHACGASIGASPQNILQDVLDDMSLEEQSEFLQELANENTSGESEDFHDGVPNSVTAHSPTSQQINNLDVLAMHEFYKRNHPKVTIIGGKKIGETVVVGKKEYWDLQRSTVLTQDQLQRINLRRIEALQRKTRLPWLIDLKNGTYQLNEYVIKNRDIKDIAYVDAHLDVPDVVEFYLDSSGSMNQGGNGFNDGTRWDMLSHVLYGFIDALVQGGRHVRKQTQLRVHNFADTQKSSPIITAEAFWNGNPEVLKILFKPCNGYDVDNIDIAKINDNKKRAYVVVTDGCLVIQGRTEREAKKMKELAQQPNNTVVLFEIGGTYDLGEAVRNDPNIRYYQVHDKQRMLNAGLEVLLAK